MPLPAPINVGAAPNDGKGDPLRTSLQKSNARDQWLEENKAPKEAPAFSTRTDLATPAFSSSWRDDGAGNLGLFVGPAGAADGAQVKVASINKASGAITFGREVAISRDGYAQFAATDVTAGRTAYLGAGAGYGYVGVTGAALLAFQTNGLTRAAITAAGKFGINTTTPGAELEVAAMDGDQDCRAQLRANADSIAQFGVSATSAFIDASGKPLVIYSSGILFGTDATQNLGGPSNRGLTAFFQTGAINTSDAHEKTPVRLLTEAERAAARDLRAEIGAFKWLDAIEKKGEAVARDHIGMTVQRAIEIMESHGLDPWRYGFICRDEITRRVKVMQTRTVRATEQVEEPYDEIEIRDGVPVLVKKSRTVERPIIEMRPVLDEAGEPIMQTVLPVFGEDGALIEQEPRPVVYPVPVMVARDIEVEIDEPAGERLAFREGQLAFFMLAGVAAP